MFQISAPRKPKFEHPERLTQGPIRKEFTEVYDVLDDSGRAIVTYYSQSRAATVVNFLNKMAESAVKE